MSDQLHITEVGKLPNLVQMGKYWEEYVKQGIPEYVSFYVETYGGISRTLWDTVRAEYNHAFTYKDWAARNSIPMDDDVVTLLRQSLVKPEWERVVTLRLTDMGLAVSTVKRTIHAMKKARKRQQRKTRQATSAAPKDLLPA